MLDGVCVVFEVSGRPSVRRFEARGLRLERRGSRDIWSSDQVHLVDALAATGDEGRSSLR